MSFFSDNDKKMFQWKFKIPVPEIKFGEFGTQGSVSLVFATHQQTRNNST